MGKVGVNKFPSANDSSSQYISVKRFFELPFLNLVTFMAIVHSTQLKHLPKGRFLPVWPCGHYCKWHLCGDLCTACPSVLWKQGLCPAASAFHLTYWTHGDAQRGWPVTSLAFWGSGNRQGKGYVHDTAEGWLQLHFFLLI